MLGARGMGITRGSGQTVPLQGQPSPCAIDARSRVQAPMTVVRELDIASPTAPTATTTYAYQDPLTAPDAFGRTDFRGFEQITERGPLAESGAQRTTIRRYDFAVDPAGREREVLTLDTGVLASVSRTRWIEQDTTGGARSYVAAETLAYTCSPRSDGSRPGRRWTGSAA